MHGRLASFILTGLSLTSSAFADSVTLKSGKVYQGTFLSATRDRITMQMDAKTRRRFNIVDIRTVTFDRAPVQQQGRSRTAPTSQIDEKYRLFSGAQGMLGYATNQEQVTADGRGRYRLYQHGSIYYTPQTGAHLVYGGIREQWTGMGSERSELGYPTSDEVATPDGGRIQYFEHGIITWTERDGAIVEISTR
jgi:hypothetical protein